MYIHIQRVREGERERERERLFDYVISCYIILHYVTRYYIMSYNTAYYLSGPRLRVREGLGRRSEGVPHRGAGGIA